MQIVEDRQAVTISNEDKKVFGILHLPITIEGPVPAVVVCPGFAGNKSGKYRVFVEIGQELAKNGIAVLRFDYRGAGDSEGDFSEITIESQVNDAIACLNFLRNDLRINGDRLGLLGRSLGGMISVLSASQFQQIRSMALWAPVFSSEPWKNIWDSLKFSSLDGLKQGALQHLPPNIPTIPNVEFLKQFFEMDLNKELASIKHIPLLHIHGKMDEFVKFEHALAYETACQANKKTSFIQLPNSNHDFSNDEERKIAIAETMQWFQKTLLNN